MTKKELINEIAERSNCSAKAVADNLGHMSDIIKEELQRGGQVVIPGFVQFKVKHVKAREGRNLRTGEPMHVPAKDVAVAVVSKTFLKDE